MEEFLKIVVQATLGLIGLSFLVFIHEMGHFLVAKWAGVRVEVFSIGFGKKLIKFQYGETIYCISAIPFGGYVAMSGEQLHSSEPIEPDLNNDHQDEDHQEIVKSKLAQDDESSEGATQGGSESAEEVFTPSSTGYNGGDFAGKPIWVRAAIALGGPLVNIIFAFIALACLYLYGVPEYEKEKLIVGAVHQGYPGDLAGILAKDTIILIDGKKTRGWNDYVEDMAMSNEEPRVHTLIRGSDTLNVTVTPTIPPAAEEWGIAYTGISAPTKVLIRGWLDYSPAKETNMQLGDQIVKINGSPIVSTIDLSTWVGNSKGKELEIEVLHPDQSVDVVRLAPKFFRGGEVKGVSIDRYLLGIGLSEEPLDPPQIVQYGMMGALGKSWNMGSRMAVKPFIYIWKMIRGKVSAKSMAGPVAIVGMIGQTMNDGPIKAILFIALISMNLGIMNLLPLAVTDGGILMFLALEAVRGKPLSSGVQLRINTVAMYFFIGFFVFVMYHDLVSKAPLLFGGK